MGEAGSEGGAGGSGIAGATARVLGFQASVRVVWFMVGLFFIIAVLGLEVFGVILAGYASASKWSLFGAMREAAGRRLDGQRAQHGIVRDQPQRQHHTARLEASELIAQVAVALLDLRGQRLVLRRNTLDRVGDAAVEQFKTIVGGERFGTTRNIQPGPFGTESSVRIAKRSPGVSCS